MQDISRRLSRLKTILASLILLIVGVVFIGIGKHSGDGVLSWVPMQELGGILIGAGVLGVWLDHYFRREEQASYDRRLRRILQDQAPEMRDAVLEAFAANHEDLVRVATPDTLDQIVENSLALRLRDERFAREVFSDIRHQAIQAPERWLDASLSVDLAPLPEVKGYFSVTIRWEYTTTPSHAQRQFVCLSDRAQYGELARTSSDTSAWFFPSDARFSARDRETFELVQFSVNGEERTIRRSSRKDFQSYSASIGEEHLETGAPVTISYTVRTITPASSHVLFFEIEQPTRDLSVVLDHTDCHLSRVSAIDLVPAVRPTRIEHSSPEVAPRNVRVEVDGWTFPRAGVAFVWTLESETSKSSGPPPNWADLFGSLMPRWRLAF